jgi:hypothetical protein
MSGGIFGDAAITAAQPEPGVQPWKNNLILGTFLEADGDVLCNAEFESFHDLTQPAAGPRASRAATRDRCCCNAKPQRGSEIGSAIQPQRGISAQ